MNYKYDIIIWEGLDRSGKTSTKKAFEELTNYKFICVDRMYITAICYEKIKNRNNNLNYYREQFEKLQSVFKVLVIYIRMSDTEIIKKRLVDEKEKVLQTKEVDSLTEIFDEEIKKINKKNVYILEMDEKFEPFEKAKKIIKDLNL